MDVATATIVGRVTHAPEIRQTQGGTEVANFSVAVNDKSRGKDKETVSYFEISAWGTKAKACADYLVKGQEVAVTGTLRIESYGKKDGTTATKVTISADQVSFGRAKDSDSGGQSSAPRSDSRPSSNRGPEPGSGNLRVTTNPPDDEDYIPF